MSTSETPAPEAKKKHAPGKSKRIVLLDKKTTRKHWDELLETRDFLRAWCKKNKIIPAVLILSVIKHFPGEWEVQKDQLGELPQGTCDYCNRTFWATFKNQKYCDTRCARANWVRNHPEYVAKKAVEDAQRAADKKKAREDKKAAADAAKQAQRDLAFPHEEDPEG